MNEDQLVTLLDDSQAAANWLKSLGIRDPRAAHRHLVAMADHGMTLDLLSEIGRQLETHMPSLGDPDNAFETLSRFVIASRNPLSFGSLIEQDSTTLSPLLQLFSASPMLGDLLVADPASYDLIRMSEGEPVEREALVAEVRTEVSKLNNDRDVMNGLRTIKRREVLRIAYGDIVRKQSADVVATQLSYLADAVCEAALAFAFESRGKKRGLPRDRDGQLIRFVAIGLRRLGGNEMDYGSPLRLFFVYESDGRTDSDRPIENREFFEKLCADFIQLLQEETELGIAYEIDVEKTPAARSQRHALSRRETIDYFDTRGRTWERQALVKARPVAGNISLGLELLDTLEPWVYRRYLSRADITGIRALKRRLERRADRKGAAVSDVEGGVLDSEFTVQYLQLISGGDNREVHVGNTLRAIEQLEQTGSLTSFESRTLRSNYDWLRRVEHRLEIMQDLKNNALPTDDLALRRLALRCGYDETPQESVAITFRNDYEARLNDNKQIINRVLEETVSDDLASSAEADLVLDHNPTHEQIAETLEPYGFHDANDAHHSLSALGIERIPFLSTRRCRYFLSLIAQPLLQKIAQTPSPDATLANLNRVSDSIGGKGVLWELFHLNPPSLDLYVRLCSSSPYLTSILTRYPGMIDELLDSLLLAELPTLGELQTTLSDLCNKVDDIEPVLHSFKNTQHLNVGVRELLEKCEIRDSMATLAGVAEACLQHIAQDQHRSLIRKYGQPCIGNTQKQSELVILAMRKFGAREPNYHSDVELITLFEADGTTSHPPTIKGRETTTNQHFFSELGQRIMKVLSEHTTHGRLYDSDLRLRPLGPSGPAAVSLNEFRDYYLSGSHAFADIRMLCPARPVFGSEPTRARAQKVLQEILTNARVTGLDSEAVRRARLDLQGTAGPRNLKRGPGGTVDIEFIVHALQLRNAALHPAILQTNLLASLEALQEHELLGQEDAAALQESYLFLRRVEAHLRLLNTTARHDLPREGDELAKLAYLLRYDGSSKLESDCARYAKQNRKLFDKLLIG